MVTMGFFTGLGLMLGKYFDSSEHINGIVNLRASMYFITRSKLGFPGNLLK